MAQAEHLPIYKASYDVWLFLEQAGGAGFLALPQVHAGSGSAGRGAAGVEANRAGQRGYDKAPLMLEVGKRSSR
jgi:hypothetical protein